MGKNDLRSRMKKSRPQPPQAKGAEEKEAQQTGLSGAQENGGIDLQRMKQQVADMGITPQSLQAMGLGAQQMQAVEQAGEKLKQYEGKSQGELMNDIVRLANEQKQAGNLDDAQIEAFANSISPMLNPGSKQMLDQILSALRSPSK